MSTLERIRRRADRGSKRVRASRIGRCVRARLRNRGHPIRDFRVDVAPLRANAGDPTALWVQQGLPDQLAQALAGRMTAQGGTLVVRIDYVTLGPIKDSSARDNISGDRDDRRRAMAGAGDDKISGVSDRPDVG